MENHLHEIFYTKKKKKLCQELYYLNLLKVMKKTYGFVSRNEIGPFNLTLNTIILAYRHEFNGEMRFFFE